MLLFLVVGQGSAAQAFDRAEFLEQSRKASSLARQKDWPAYRQALLDLRERNPGILTPRWLLLMASVEMRLGHKTEALRWLLDFSRMGLVYDVASDPDLAPLTAEPGFKTVAERLRRNQQPVSRASVACVLPQADLMPEDITYDSERRWFVVTSIRRHGLYRLQLPAAEGAPCALEELPLPPRAKAWPSMAVSYDRQRHALWMTASALDFPGVPREEQGKSLLLMRDETTGQIRQEVPAPEGGPVVFGDMSLAENGALFVTDSRGQGIYRLAGDTAKPALEKISVGLSPQSPVLASDGKLLFVADYPLGIARLDLSRVNLSTPTATEMTYLAHPDDVAVTGIDGLYRVGDSLLAVQNGTNPARILRLRLNRDQTAILSAEVLEQSPHSMDSNHAVLLGDSLYYLSNVGWDHVDDRGNLKPGAQFAHPVLMRLPLGVQGAGNGPAAQQEAQVDADVEQLKALTREFVAGFNSGDLDRMMRFYADRYVDVNLRHPVQTKAERREYYRKIVERGDTQVEVTPDEIIVHGDIGVVRGTLLVTRTPKDGPPRRVELRYIEIWQKFPDGWKSIMGIDAELYPDEK